MSDNVKSNQAGNAVSGPGCNGSIPIVPLRYAIMPTSESNKQQYAYEKSKGNLEKGFEKTQTSQYTLRTIRSGYIYLYDEKNGVLRLWEADGEGNFTALQWSSMEDYGKRSNRLETLPYIWAFDCPHTVHIAFSNDLWPKSIVQKAESDAAFRALRMQPLKIDEILDGSGKISTQKHVLPVDELDKMVEEYRIPKQGHKEALGWSTFTPNSFTMPSNIKAMGAKYGVTHRIKLPVVFALKDAQGITEDQGNLASLYMHQLTDIKSKISDKENNSTSSTTIDLPDVIKLNTSQISNLSVDFHRKKVISNIIDSLLLSTYPNKKELNSAIIRSRQNIKKGKPNKRGRYSKNPIQRHVGESEARLHSLTDTNVNESADELIDHVDMDKLYKFRREWDLVQKELEEKKKKVLIVVEDHAKWLKTGEQKYFNNPNSLAACWSCYDRNNKLSAYALEVAIVLSMDGMGVPVPGMLKQDRREELLDKWINDLKSPIHIAAATFKPYEKKKDSIADLYAGANSTIEGLLKLYPYTVATEKIVNIITTYSIRKIPKKTRWSSSKSVARNVAEAIKGSNLEKLLKALHGRYAGLIKTMEESVIKTKYITFINRSIEHSKKVQQSLDIKGTRAVAITHGTTTTSYKPIISANLLREIAKTPLTAYISYLHAMNLTSAVKSFSRDASVKNNLELTSAVLGAIGAFLETSAVAGAIINKTRLTNTKIIGKAAQSAVFSRLTGVGFAKFFGYAGAIAEGSVHIYDSFSLASDGDNDAASWKFSAGVLLTTGGIATTYGGGLIAAALTGAAGSSVVPGIGWVVAGILLIGAGIGALIMSASKKDTPMQIWVSKSIFGIPRRTMFKGTLVDDRFDKLSEELEGYFVTTYMPRVLEEIDDKVFGTSAETDWDQNIGDDNAKFVILLPGYTEGTSKWTQSNIIGYDSNDVDSKEDADKANIIFNNSKGTGLQRIKPEGLYLNINQYFDDRAASASITIDYWPNQAITDQKVTQTFYVDQ